MDRKDIDKIVILNEELLDPVFGERVLIDMSWSRYNTYLECNARYGYKYVQKEKEPTGAPLILGKAIHEAMESVIKYNVTDETEAIGFYLMAIDKNKSDIPITAVEIEEGRDQVVNTLTNINLVTHGSVSNVKGIETGFKYIIGRGLFLGFIDLITVGEDEHGSFINVIDFKSNKTKYSVKGSGQMKLYTLIVKSLFPDMRVKASLYWTRHSKMATYQFSQEELDKFVQETEDNVIKIINDREFKPNAQMIKCVYCQFAGKDQCKKGYSNRYIMERSMAKKKAMKKE